MTFETSPKPIYESGRSRLSKLVKIEEYISIYIHLKGIEELNAMESLVNVLDSI